MPIVGPDRLPKLKTVLTPLFSIRDNYKYKDHYPLDESGKTKGYCFVEYETKEAASTALLACDGHRLDKNHVFSAYPFTAIKNIEKPDHNWKPPAKREYQDLGDLWWWLQNPKCMDHFAVQYEMQIKGGIVVPQLDVYGYVRNADPIPVPDAQRQSWTESLFKWSTNGTYLATMHQKGVALWAGERFEKFQRFEHEGVNYIDFSPNEKYLVTYRREERRAGGDSENCLRVFDTFTGEMKKAFSPTGSFRIPDWPFLKWSYDEHYFAFCRPKGNSINVFDTENFTLCGNKPIDLDGLVRFEFNPVKMLIAYYCEERIGANQPAEIGILEFPSRNKVRAQRTFNVSEANLYWQKAGNYFAAHTERYTNRKVQKEEVKLSGVTSHLEIFDCTGKEVSVQTIQLPEPLISFAWEPKGDKFCVLLGSGQKVQPVVYRLDSGKPMPQILSKLDPALQLNSIEWAPQGGWLAAFAANSPSGNIYFLDTNGPETTRFRVVEQPYINQGNWDPTGRYFVTCTFARNRYESGYTVFTFQGRQIYHKVQDQLIRFKWRPRPPVQIVEQKMREIKKSLKQLSAKFDEEDRRELTKISNELLELRRKALDEFAQFRESNRTMFQKERQERLMLRSGKDVESITEDLIEVQETVALETKIEKLDEETTSPAVDGQ